MDNLTKTQVVLLVLLVSFVTSMATGIVAVTLMDQAPPPVTQTINKVIEKIVSVEAPRKEEKPPQTIVINQEDKRVRIIKEISSAVVSVIATKDIPVVEQYYIDPFGDGPLKDFRSFFPDVQIPQYRQKGTEKRQVSGGTGFFISKDGLILTNKHVVEDVEAQYSVILNDGSKLDVKVLARDPIQDIAVLKAEGENFNFISLGDSDAINVGQEVIAIGNVLGEFQNTVSVGVVSGLNRNITAQGSTSGPENLQGLIQTDAAINPGNSGGPLLDLSGKAIGINTARAQADNVGFALAINLAKKGVEDAKEFGRIRYPYLGIRYQPVDKGLLIIKGENGEPAIDPNGPAAKAGLKEGDIITALDKVDFNKQNSLTVVLLSAHRVGETVKLKVLRDGKEMTISLTLEERPEAIK